MKESKKENILAQAVLALYENPHATMHEIAQKVNISRATLYRYFETRDSLIVAAYVRNHKLFMELLAPILDEPITAKEKCMKFFHEYIPFCFRNEYVRHNSVYLDYPESRAAYEEKKDVMRELIRQMKAEGDIDKAITDEWMVILFKNLVHTSWETVKQGYAGKNNVVDNIEYLLFGK